MEFVDVKASETNLWPEMGLKSTNPQVICEDLWVGTGGNAISGDDLFVEGLLNFSNEDFHAGFVEDEEEEEDKDSLSASSSQEDQNPSHAQSELSLKEEPLSVQESVLCVPADDLADLEWLSHFYEDSFSEFSLQHVTKTPPEKNPQISQNQSRAQSRADPVSLKRPVEFATSIPPKSKRSKRSRTTIGRVWSVGSLSTPTATATEPSSCSSSSPTSSSSTSCVTASQPPLDLVRAAGKPPGRKQKRKLGAEPPLRRCSHCGVVKTPQWRTGPNGAKTLCNACGVRFKSGRLLPEYRPACSPTFSSAVHSNNHRKVLEMRRKKEMGLVEPGPAAAVQSF